MLSLVLSAALVFGPSDASVVREMTEAFVSSCTPRDAGTIRGRLAANWLSDRVNADGADIVRDAFFADTPKGRRRFTNLYSEFESDPTSRWVVVVSHYDTKPGSNCPGANDGAVTSALLMRFASLLHERKAPRGNVMLVWTDGEECMGDHYVPGDGFQGSQRAAEYLKSKNRKVQAVICLDMLGDRDLSVSIPANGSKSLARIAYHAARRIGEDRLVTLSDILVKDDHLAFLEAGYPAIDLIDFEYGPDNSWWHTSADTIDKIAEDSILKVGRLVAEMLEILI